MPTTADELVLAMRDLCARMRGAAERVQRSGDWRALYEDQRGGVPGLVSQMRALVLDTERFVASAPIPAERDSVMRELLLMDVEVTNFYRLRCTMLQLEAAALECACLPGVH